MPARKTHRLVCKAVADAVAAGIPEIALFLSWPSSQAQARSATARKAQRIRDKMRTPGDILEWQVVSMKRVFLGSDEYRPFRFRW